MAMAGMVSSNCVPARQASCVSGLVKNGFDENGVQRWCASEAGMPSDWARRSISATRCRAAGAGGTESSPAVLVISFIGKCTHTRTELQEVIPVKS